MTAWLHSGAVAPRAGGSLMALELGHQLFLTLAALFGDTKTETVNFDHPRFVAIAQPARHVIAGGVVALEHFECVPKKDP